MTLSQKALETYELIGAYDLGFREDLENLAANTDGSAYEIACNMLSAYDMLCTHADEFSALVETELPR